MNWWNFIRLMWLIYGSNPKPDLSKIEKMGLLAVKIGQMYALRIDFLGVEKCQHLSKLYRNTSPLKAQDFRKLFELHAPQKLKDDIEEIEDKPLAAASVGQVHKAKLKNGKEVVIKIIKNSYKEIFKRDISKVRSFFKFVLFFYPTLRRVADPMGTLDDIEYTTLRELNLLNEIIGLKRIQEVLDSGKEMIDTSVFAFQKLYPEYSGERILVSDLIPGKSFDEMLSQKTLDYELLLKLFLAQGYGMFIFGEFHGDIHPGNIILNDNDKKIYFLDISTIATVKQKFSAGLLKFFGALIEYDYDLCVDRLHEMSDAKLNETELKKYKKYFLNLYKDFRGKTVSELSLTRQMMFTVRSAVEHGMSFEREVFAVIKSLMYLDGMVIKCNPEALLLEDMKPLVKKFLEKL
jgi:ubiquinone biosynthesis protein